MADYVRLQIPGDEEFAEETFKAIQQAGVQTSERRVRGGVPVEILIALSTAGVFTTLVQTITLVLEKHKDREVTIEYKGKRVTLKGHSPHEEMKVLQTQFPELFKTKKDRKKK